MINIISGAPAGTCHLWGWSYQGLSYPVVGDHISTLNDTLLEDISDNWITVVRNSVTGLGEKRVDIKLVKVFPVPAKDILNIDAENIEIIGVSSLIGSLQLEERVSSKIDVSGLSSVTYILEIQHTDGTRSVTKFIHE